MLHSAGAEQARMAGRDLLLCGKRLFVSRPLGFGHTTVAAGQGLAATQTIAITPLLDALARDP
jgi:hypothetical protein